MSADLAPEQSNFGLRPQRGADKKKGGKPKPAAQKGENMLNIPEPTVQGNELSGKTKLAERIRLVGTINMTPVQWARVMDNPRQRDTERRAQFAEHLKVPHPAHVKVNAAQTLDGRLFKLDGHTRSFLWSTGQVEAPKNLYVDIWHCDDLEDVKELYATFDSSKAVENATDQVFGALRELDLAFSSPSLKSKRFAAAMRYAYELLYGQIGARDVSIADLTRYWREELLLLDECGPSSDFFHTGILAAALITFKRYGDRATPFWKAYANNAGKKTAEGMDAVQALLERNVRLREARAVSGRPNVFHIMAICLSAFDSYRSGFTYALRHGSVKAYGEASLREWIIATKDKKPRR